MLTLAATAQTVEHTPEVQKIDGSNISDIYSARAAAAGAESRWLSWYYRARVLEYGDNPIAADDFNIVGVTTAPDSLMYYGVDNPVWVNSLGQVLQPSHSDFDYLDENNAFSLDSIAVDFVYTRELADNSIVDTIEISIPNLSTAGTITWTDNNALMIPYTANADLTKFGALTNAAKTIKVPLTVSDTSSLIQSLTEHVGINYGAEDLIGATARFIPGYSYQLNDTIFNKNYVTFITFEEVDGAEPNYATLDNYNKSYIMPIGVRYQQNTGTQEFLNGTYLPTAIYTAGFAYEHHSISFLVTSPNVGIEDFESIGVSLSPNPTNGILNITSESNSTTVSVFDVLGQEVLSTVNSGNFSIDLTSENTGIYFVSISNELGSATSKIIRN